MIKIADKENMDKIVKRIILVISKLCHDCKLEYIDEEDSFLCMRVDFDFPKKEAKEKAEEILKSFRKKNYKIQCNGVLETEGNPYESYAYFIIKLDNAIFRKAMLKRWNNGVSEKRSVKCPGDGWKLGALNFPYWNNGIELRRTKECPGEGWVRGACLKKGKKIIRPFSRGLRHWNNGIESIRSMQCPGQGWVRGILKRKFNKLQKGE